MSVKCVQVDESFAAQHQPTGCCVLTQDDADGPKPMDADGGAVSKDEDDIARSEHSSGALFCHARRCTTMRFQAHASLDLRRLSEP